MPAKYDEEIAIEISGSTFAECKVYVNLLEHANDHQSRQIVLSHDVYIFTMPRAPIRSP